MLCLNAPLEIIHELINVFIHFKVYFKQFLLLSDFFVLLMKHL